MVKFVARIMGPAFLGMAFASTAFADGITLNGNLSAPNYLYYSFTATDTITYNLPVAPYPSTTTIYGVTTTSFLACLDINNGTDVGAFYSGTFGVAQTTADYEVSWLADQMAGTSPSSPSSSDGPIAMAIWQVEFPSSNNSEGGTDPIDPASAVWISDAAAAVAAGYQPDSVFFFPDNTTSQRFVEVSVTGEPGTLPLLAPEPGTMGMMGAGLMGLAGILRRRLAR
jgi:hypothetical protein